MFRKPHQYIKTWKTKLWVTLIFFIAISFMLLFLEPFKTGESPKILVLGYSVSVLGAYTAMLVLETVIFKYKRHWRLKNEIMIAILFFILSAIGVYWYDLVVIKAQAFHWGGLLSFTGRVTLPFTIILLPFVIWLRHHYGKIYELPDQYQVIIKGNVKSDVLEMDRRNILYVKSSDNYVVVKYIEGGVFKEALLRSRLAQVGEQLPEFQKCHRSYIINPLYLVAVEGNQKKAYLKLDQLEEDIPISKTYYTGIKTSLING